MLLICFLFQQIKDGTVKTPVFHKVVPSSFPVKKHKNIKRFLFHASAIFYKFPILNKYSNIYAQKLMKQNRIIIFKRNVVSFKKIFQYIFSCKINRTIFSKIMINLFNITDKIIILLNFLNE